MRTQLTEGEEALQQMAYTAARRAYCPYSRFAVGAACETDIGCFVGCNIESASYGLCCCAERVALFSAVAQGAESITRLAVACTSATQHSLNEKVCCGACRQVMVELMEKGAEIIIYGVGVFTLDELLPIPFRIELDQIG